MSATYTDTETNGTANGGNVKFELNLHHVYHKPSAKELADARPCRLFLVFTFILFLVGFLVSSIVLIVITDKCNNRDKKLVSVTSMMQYQVYMKSFQDSDNDGLGDINGLKSKLPYIKSLGVDSILLNDIISDIDFTLDAKVGSEEDFQDLVTCAKEMGLGIFLQMNPFVTSKIGDLFKEGVNSTLNWDWFVWCEKNKTNNWVSGSGASAWHASDNVPGYMYYSYYGKHLPTLNLRNENVTKMIQKKMMWWLRFGARGFVFSDVSRLTVDHQCQANASNQLDQDHASSHRVLSTFYESLHKIGAELWVIPGTSIKLTSGYLGTGKLPESDFVLSDQLAQNKAVNVKDLNHSISTLIASHSSRDQVGWLFDGPTHQRIASRLNREQAVLMSLFLLTLPNQILPYYGDERLLKDDKSGKSTSYMIFDKQADGGAFPNNSTLPASKTNIIDGFTELAELRSIDGVFTGTPKVVYADRGTLVMVYLGNSLVAVNFDGKGGVISNLEKYGKYGKILFSVNEVDVMLHIANMTIPPYGLFVVKMIY